MKTKVNAAKIVSSVKEYTRCIDKFYGDEINFLGCSEPYVEEKIDHLIYQLQHLKKHTRSIDKAQERSKVTV